MKAKTFFQALDESRVIEAIDAAETMTSGELRVFVSRRKLRGADVREKARAEFGLLGMDATRRRNAVLFYVVPCEQAFAVIGDEAVHAKCGQEFWEQTARAVAADFAAGHFTEGLVRGIRRAGELLAEHFPKAPQDRNELPDEIVRD
jgi:uncharacterized membrane protein